MFGGEVIQAAKVVIPPEMLLLMRIFAQEYSNNGFSAESNLNVMKRSSIFPDKIERTEFGVILKSVLLLVSDFLGGDQYFAPKLRIL
ncbi:hypothetical protein EDC44_12216 [Cricetibacter osteomyelitidis]|uniref:Uncharacterized protein n=1 Tax=Cricetibacter osteomyelitidis TaxID=1521931 RepID=A0A4R2SWK2_9PAST|nr:hypothetical protein EDC44_12216 [Cricetibacter osteomyelitidis]